MEVAFRVVDETSNAIFMRLGGRALAEHPATLRLGVIVIPYAPAVIIITPIDAPVGGDIMFGSSIVFPIGILRC